MLLTGALHVKFALVRFPLLVADCTHRAKRSGKACVAEITHKGLEFVPEVFREIFFYFLTFFSFLLDYLSEDLSLCHFLL